MKTETKILLIAVVLVVALALLLWQQLKPGDTGGGVMGIVTPAKKQYTATPPAVTGGTDSFNTTQPPIISTGNAATDNFLNYGL